MIGSNEEDILILEEPDENIFLNIRHTKDFCYITLNVFSDIHSKVLLFILHFICVYFCLLLMPICSFSGVFNKSF
jgi:hypothetical protein